MSLATIGTPAARDSITVNGWPSVKVGNTYRSASERLAVDLGPLQRAGHVPGAAVLGHRGDHPVLLRVQARAVVAHDADVQAGDAPLLQQVQRVQQRHQALALQDLADEQDHGRVVHGGGLHHVLHHHRVGDDGQGDVGHVAAEVRLARGGDQDVGVGQAVERGEGPGVGPSDPVLPGGFHVRGLGVVVQQDPGAAEPGRDRDGHLPPPDQPRVLHGVRVHHRPPPAQPERVDGVGHGPPHVLQPEPAPGVVVLGGVEEHHLELAVQLGVLDQVHRHGGDAALDRWPVGDDHHADAAEQAVARAASGAPATSGRPTVAAADHPCRVAHHRGPGRDVVDHHGARTDGGAVAHRAPGRG